MWTRLTHQAITNGANLATRHLNRHYRVGVWHSPQERWQHRRLVKKVISLKWEVGGNNVCGVKYLTTRDHVMQMHISIIHSKHVHDALSMYGVRPRDRGTPTEGFPSGRADPLAPLATRSDILYPGIITSSSNSGWSNCLPSSQTRRRSSTTRRTIEAMTANPTCFSLCQQRWIRCT